MLFTFTTLRLSLAATGLSDNVEIIMTRHLLLTDGEKSQPRLWLNCEFKLCEMSRLGPSSPVRGNNSVLKKGARGSHEKLHSRSELPSLTLFLLK